MSDWLQLTGSESRDVRLTRMTQAARSLREAGLIQCVADDWALTGRTLSVNGHEMLHFGNCSYLGLETDPRLKAGACHAIERYGTQFSSSRSFCSISLYREFEALLSQLVGGYPIVVAPTTTLAHVSALPQLVGSLDTVLYDTHVHNSVQAALPQLGLAPGQVRALKHNRLDLLEAELELQASSEGNVFYLCDGVYSMQGDTVDVPRLLELLERFPKLHVYVDDAHGVGWTGKHGAGVVLGRYGLHERMVVVLGLAKGFGASGAVIVCPKREWADRIFSFGSGLVFSGPMQPAQLGAGIAAAKILLSEELPMLQAEVRARVELFDTSCREAGIPMPDVPVSPIRFIPIGDEEKAIELCQNLQEAGCFTNLSMFPAVPRGRAGVRVVFTRHLTLSDVQYLTRSLIRQFQGPLKSSLNLAIPAAPVAA